MNEALHKWIWHASCNLLAVIVVSLVVYIKYWHVYVAHPMAHDIDCHHWISVFLLCVLVLVYVVLVAVLRSKILAKAKRLCFHPSLLQLYENELRLVCTRTDTSTKVNAKHGYLVVTLIGILMWP